MPTYEYLLQKYGIALTFEQAGKELGLYWQTIRVMCARGDIPAIKAGRKWVLTTKALATYIDEGPQTKVLLPRKDARYRKIV
ncbi:MAG: helix-turn-helix domain-containing protein [Acetivibrionales bacterium]